MTYALIIHPAKGESRIEEYASPYDMAYAHRNYALCNISVTPTIDGVKVYAMTNESGIRSYIKPANN